MLAVIVKALGPYESDYLTSIICSFLQCKNDNDVILDPEVLSLCLQDIFGGRCDEIAAVVDSFLVPPVVTRDVVVNTNEIEGRWPHIRRHDGNRGGKFLGLNLENKVT